MTPPKRSKRTRRKFSGEFKAKVALEAIKAHETINQIAARYEVHPHQVTQWKQQLLQQAARDRRSAQNARQRLRQQQNQYRRSAGQKDRQLNISQQNADANTTRAQDAGKGSGKDRFGNTPKQRRAAQDSFTRAMSFASVLPNNTSPKTVEAFLISKDVNAVMARAAAQMAANGYVDAKTARQLRVRGVRRGYSTKRKAPAQPQFPTINNGGLSG